MYVLCHLSLTFALQCCTFVSFMENKPKGYSVSYFPPCFKHKKMVGPLKVV